MRFLAFLITATGLLGLALAAPAKREDHINVTTALARGDIVVCKTNLNDGPCVVARAENKCAILPSSVSHQVRTIHQPAGSICQYYSAACSTPPVATADSRSKPLTLTIAPDVGSRIGAVRCSQRLASTAGARRAVPNATVLSTALSHTSRTFRPGDTLVCDAEYYVACSEPANAMGRCSNFDPGWGGVSSLAQIGGAVCKWYRGFGCARESRDSAPLVLDSTAGVMALGRLGGDGNKFQSVECRREMF